MKAGSSADSRSIQSIQALRALAALLVVFEHVDMAKVGAFGVDIFFVISGFVIAYVSRTDTPARFMLKRLFRIIPLYWSATVLVFLVACLAPWALKSTTNDLGDLIKSLLFIPYMKDSGAVQPVLFLGWTLNYEMFFYAIFAASMVMWPKMPAIPATVAILSLIVFGLVLKPHSIPGQFWTAPLMMEFVFGVWLFVGWNARTGFDLSPVWSWAGIFVLILWMMWAQIERLSFDREVVFGIPAAVIVALALWSEKRVIIPPIILAIGDASYSLYLLHPYLLLPAQRAIQHAFQSPVMVIAALPLIFMAAIGCALFSYWLIERPSNRWLRARYL